MAENEDDTNLNDNKDNANNKNNKNNHKAKQNHNNNNQHHHHHHASKQKNAKESPQDKQFLSTDSFEDDHFRQYPAKRIIETSYNIDEYELIVDKTMAKIAAGQVKMASAVKGLVRLAYNNLMDPIGKQDELFFHKHKRFNENWQTNSNRAAQKEKLEDKTTTDDDEDDHLPKLVLLNRSAPINQRKAAIGVWAMCHLRAMVHSKEWLHRFFAKKDTPSEIIEEIYGFKNPYEFYCKFERDTYELLRQEFSKKKCDPEVLYLFYRGAIVLEHIFHRPELRSSKSLLLRVAYGNPNGFREYGLDLYSWFRSAARDLHISHEQLSSDLTWALSDGPYDGRSHKSIETCLELMKFHRKYYSEQSAKSVNSSVAAASLSLETKKDESTNSRYFMYARVVNGDYFSHLDADTNEELYSILIEICRLKGDSYIPDGKVSALWKERAELRAKKICQRHAKQNNSVNTHKSDHSTNNRDQRSSSNQGRDSRATNKKDNNNKKDQNQNQNQKRGNSTQRSGAGGGGGGANGAANQGQSRRAGSVVRNDRAGPNRNQGNNTNNMMMINNHHQHKANTHQLKQNQRASSQIRNHQHVMGISVNPASSMNGTLAYTNNKLNNHQLNNQQQQQQQQVRPTARAPMRQAVNSNSVAADSRELLVNANSQSRSQSQGRGGHIFTAPNLNYAGPNAYTGGRHYNTPNGSGQVTPGYNQMSNASRPANKRKDSEKNPEKCSII